MKDGSPSSEVNPGGMKFGQYGLFRKQNRQKLHELGKVICFPLGRLEMEAEAVEPAVLLQAISEVLCRAD